MKSTGLSILPDQGYLVYTPVCLVVLVDFWMMAPILSIQAEILPKRSIGGEGTHLKWDTPQVSSFSLWPYYWAVADAY